MFYLCLAASVAWGVYFIYLVFLDIQIKDVKRRLDARINESSEDQN